MAKMRAGFATLKQVGLACPQCTGKIVRGEPVLVVEQNQFVPFNVRVLVFHDACVRAVLPRQHPEPRKPRTPRPKPPAVAAATEGIAEVYHATRTRAQTLAWLEETAPDSDLMRWTPSHAVDE